MKAEPSAPQSRMTIPVIIIGGLIVFFSVVAFVVFLPYLVVTPKPTDKAHALQGLAAKGRQIYLQNGCTYCHTQFVRDQDWAIGVTAEPGDYYYEEPHLLGSERTGPDLSYVGGTRTDQWHRRHLKDPRSTSPGSLMAPFDFLKDDDIDALLAYLQTLQGGKHKVRSVEPEAPHEYASLKSTYKKLTALEWSQASALFMRNCSTCHGPAGEGHGTYAMHVVTPPANLTTPHFARLPDQNFYWRISEGLPGTAMPPWKMTLTEDERWLVAAYAKTFSNKNGSPMGLRRGTLYSGLKNPLKDNREAYQMGEQIYADNCAACHGEKGDGLGQAELDVGFQPKPRNLTSAGLWRNSDSFLFWRVSEGVPGTRMPAWRLMLDENERWAVLEYARHFSGK